MLDTHFYFIQHGQILSDPLDVSSLSFFGQAEGFGESFILIIF